MPAPTVEQIQAVLGVAIPVLDALANLTPTHIDNEAVDFLRALKDSRALIEAGLALFDGKISEAQLQGILGASQ